MRRSTWTGWIALAIAIYGVVETDKIAMLLAIVLAIDYHQTREVEKLRQEIQRLKEPEPPKLAGH